MRVRAENYLTGVHDQKSLDIFKNERKFSFYRLVLEKQSFILFFI